MYMHAYTEREHVLNGDPSPSQPFSTNPHPEDYPGTMVKCPLSQIREIKDACPDLFESWGTEIDRRLTGCMLA